MPLGDGARQNVGLRNFYHSLTLLPPGASVFHKHMSSFPACDREHIFSFCFLPNCIFPSVVGDFEYKFETVCLMTYFKALTLCAKNYWIYVIAFYFVLNIFFNQVCVCKIPTTHALYNSFSSIFGIFPFSR